MSWPIYIRPTRSRFSGFLIVLIMDGNTSIGCGERNGTVELAFHNLIPVILVNDNGMA